MTNMTKKQLIRELKAKGVTAINGKALRKHNKGPLEDYWNNNFVIETKNVSEDAIEIVPEKESNPISLEKTKPISLKKSTDVDVDDLLNKAKESGKKAVQEIKYTTWQKRILSLVQDVYKVDGKSEWVIPQSDLMSVLGMNENSSAIKYATDWKVRSGMSAGVALWSLRYEGTLSKAKGNERLIIREITKEKQQEVYEACSEKIRAKLKAPIR